jgi:hypothetical protein
MKHDTEMIPFRVERNSTIEYLSSRGGLVPVRASASKPMFALKPTFSPFVL